MTGRSHPARGAWIEIRRPAYAWRFSAGRTPQGVRGLKYLLSARLLPGGRRTPQGVRGLKSPMLGGWPSGTCRTPQGVRGLKCSLVRVAVVGVNVSHPARGAWIEIRPMSRPTPTSTGRTPQGVRGLK